MEEPEIKAVVVFHRSLLEVWFSDGSPPVRWSGTLAAQRPLVSCLVGFVG